MDMLKKVTGNDKAEETKPGFVDSSKSAAEAAKTNAIDQSEKAKDAVTGATTTAVETAKDYGKSGQEAVGNAQTTVTSTATNAVETANDYRKSGQEAVGKAAVQAGDYVKPAEAEPVAKKEEGTGNVVTDAVAKVGALFK